VAITKPQDRPITLEALRPPPEARPIMGPQATVSTMPAEPQPAANIMEAAAAAAGDMTTARRLELRASAVTPAWAASMAEEVGDDVGKNFNGEQVRNESWRKSYVASD
jgi:hypothetical protein